MGHHVAVSDTKTSVVSASVKILGVFRVYCSKYVEVSGRRKKKEDYELMERFVSDVKYVQIRKSRVTPILGWGSGWGRRFYS